MRAFFLLYTLLLAAGLSAARKSYNGYRVVRLPTRPNFDDLFKIRSIIRKLHLHTWKLPKRPGLNVDIMVSPEELPEFERLTVGLDIEVLHQDLGIDIELEGRLPDYAGGYFDDDSDLWFRTYHSYDDHMRWLSEFQAAYPDNAELVVSGNSIEGRPITGIHIWGAGGKGTKPAAVFYGTMHSREWITTMVVEYIAQNLASGYKTDPAVEAIVDNHDIYIFPIANPDGFVYTQLEDRMWRKNRQKHETSECWGRDLNRNWPYEWLGDGSSPDPCDDAYRGETPGDAPETVVHVNFLEQLANSNGIKVFIDFHSYSQYFMTPYGYDCWVTPENDSDLQILAKTFADALEAVYGTKFRTGTICGTVYEANGNSVDWVSAVAGAETAFAAELRDTGTFGFVLPPDQIIPSGNETWAGFKALMTKLGPEGKKRSWLKIK